MKLNYRGATYTLAAPVVGLQNSNPTTTDLSYRGNRYSTNQAVADDVEDVAPVTFVEATDPAVTIGGDRARLLMMNHHRQVKHRQQVMLSRAATSIGLDGENAAQYWNHVQGKVHPGFWATYDRSHASSS